MLKAGRYLGSHYDFFGLFGMSFVSLGRVLRRKWKNPCNSTKAMFCSELVATVLKDSRYPKTETGDFVPSKLSPQDLLEFMETSAKENTPARPTSTAVAD